MKNKLIRCGLLGGQEMDLQILSEIHRRENLKVAFVYDPAEGAVGLEIAEILGIERYHKPAQLANVGTLDYIVVSEPQGRFADELETLRASGAKVITPAAAASHLWPGEKKTASQGPSAATEAPHTIDDTLVAIERLLDRQELLKFLLDVAVKATSSNAGSIMLYSRDARELYIAYATGLSERVIRNTRQKLGQGIAGKVALTKKAKLLEMSPNQTLYAKDRERLDIGSAISVPLMWANDLLGVLNVSAGRGGRRHDREDLKKLTALSQRLSRVLFESLKLQQVQMQHRESEFRSTMGQIAERTIGTQTKFNLLSRYLAELVGAETVELFMNTREGDWFALGGSNRWLTPMQERVRCQKGALSQTFLENRCIVLTETRDPGDDPSGSVFSVVYCPLSTKDPGGVMSLEFADAHKFDEFMMINHAIVAEMSRFVAAEMREHRLKREIEAFAKVSDAAAALLACRSVGDLGDVLARVVADALESRRVSVRLRGSREDDEMTVSHLSAPDDRSQEWIRADEDRFERLAGKKQPFSMAFLTFDSTIRSSAGDCHSLLAYPIQADDVFLGGIIAYDKHPDDPMEDAVYTDLERDVLKHLTLLIMPVLDSIIGRAPHDVQKEPKVYTNILKGNAERLGQLITSEISRSDRYHHTFALILFVIKPLDTLFDKDHKRALELVDDITQGLQTRTRKTDHGFWIRKNTYAMLTLEGGKRIRFLVSRALLYLLKDLSTTGELEIQEGDILVGSAGYPGTAKTSDELVAEAMAALKAHSR